MVSTRRLGGPAVGENASRGSSLFLSLLCSIVFPSMHVSTGFISRGNRVGEAPAVPGLEVTAHPSQDLLSHPDDARQVITCSFIHQQTGGCDRSLLNTGRRDTGISPSVTFTAAYINPNDFNQRPHLIETN